MDYFNRIKNVIENDIINQRKYDIYKNASLVNAYFEVGRLIVRAQGGKNKAKYGDELIKKWSIKLTQLYGKGYSEKNLKRMRTLFIFFEKEKRSPLVTELSWTNLSILLSIKDENKRNYYINMCLKHNLTKRNLMDLIKSNSYERLSQTAKNNIKIIKRDTTIKIEDTIKDPIYVTVDQKVDKLSEKALKNYIIDQIEKFFIELGVGYTFVGSEYKLGNRYCDLLLFNYEYLCFVVVELKIRKLSPQDIGQIQYYMNYIDFNLKKDIFNKTIGIIITKENDRLVISYSSNPDIYKITYKLIYV